MQSRRQKVTNALDTYTELVHIIFGLATAYITSLLFPLTPLTKILLVSLLGAVILPDLDHILYMFWYGRKNETIKYLKNILKEDGLRQFWKMSLKTHKEIVGLYSHNIVSLAIVIGFYIWASIFNDYALKSALTLGWISHYIWDMTEDLIYFGGLNPNWFLRFNQKRRIKK